MLNFRKLGSADLYQIIEFAGPTHDTKWLFPDLPPDYLADNVSWLYPHFWTPPTNRMIFTMPIFVLKTGRETIVIDTGVGNFRHRRSSSQNMINAPMMEWLQGIGAAPESVTHVINTHLHGDHVGWNTVLTPDGWEPFFPNATYYMPRLDFDSFKLRYDGGEREVYGRVFAECVLPVVDAGLTRFMEEGDLIADCLLVKPGHGHTPGQITLTFQADQEYIFSADVIHSPTQVAFPQVNSRWCELPEVARKSRIDLLNHASDSEAVLFTAHGRNLNGWMITREGDGFRYREGSYDQ